MSKLTFVLTFALAACSMDAEPGATRGSPQPGAAGSASDPAALAASCAQANLTQPCRCGTQSGRQVCDGRAWKACECTATTGAPGVSFEGNNRTDIHFVWEKTATNTELGGCLPGNYEGTFGGIYWSYIATLAPIEDLAVPIANIDIPGEPSGFRFSVEPAQGGETVLQIKGQMVGTADLTFPFSANLEG